MFDQIIDPDNVRDAHRKTLLGKHKFRPAAVRFNRNETQNLAALVDEVRTGNYAPDGFNEFYVLEPKERLIFAPKYRDKIVQHMINKPLRDYFEPKFIFDSYACIRGKGNQRAIRRLQHFTRKVQWESRETPCLCKIDMAKFFYSIDHDTLKRVLAKRLHCPRTIALLDTVIDHSPDVIGLPLGNLCSQIFANVLMNEADQYAKRVLKCRYYLRYADDVFVLCHNKRQANSVLHRLSAFLRDDLCLLPNPVKSFVTPACRGFTALGYRVYPTHILLSSQNKRRVKRRIKTGQMTPQSFNSWMTYASEASCYNFVQSLKVHANDLPR